MPSPKATYPLRVDLWQYPGMAAWHFATIPEKESAAIKAAFGKHARNWGSLPVRATVGKTTWQSSIFPDKKRGGYLFPIKAEVRKKEQLVAGCTFTLTLTIGG